MGLPQASMNRTWVAFIPRISVRRLMVVVTLIALAIAGIETRRRAALAARFQRLAAKYASLEVIQRTSAEISLSNRQRYADQPDALKVLDEQARRASADAERFARLKTKYARAAARPWESLAPDPSDTEPPAGW